MSQNNPFFTPSLRSDLKKNGKMDDKLGLSCAKLSKAYASYPLALAGNYDVIPFSYLLSKRLIKLTGY